MSIQLNQWNHSLKELDDEVEFFNKILSTDLTVNVKDLEEIDEKIQDTMKELKEVLDHVKEREEKLSTNCFAFSNGKMRLISGLNVSICLFTVAGLVLTSYEDPALKYTGIGTTALATAIYSIFNNYSVQISIQMDQKSKLSSFSEKGLKNAELFRKFIENFTELKEKELKQVAQKDELIADCLHKYEALPTKYKREEVYARIASALIHALPADDPLRAELEKATSHEKDNGERPRPDLVDYISNPSPKSDSVVWSGEQSNMNKPEKRHEKPQLDYNYVCTKHFVQRFKVFHIPAFIDLSDGLRLTPNGIVRLNDTVVRKLIVKEKISDGKFEISDTKPHSIREERHMIIPIPPSDEQPDTKSLRMSNISSNV